MKSPFKFLDAFTLEDSDSFFGREKEIDALYQMVFETPLTLIYGLSGTGKTSLVQCGLASRFDGPDWFPFFIRRNENINDSLHAELDDCIERKTEMTLTEKVSYLSTYYLRPVFLIFDQFEELFILGDEEEQRKFVTDVNELLQARLHCKVILIIREEYLGQLYHFENEIPYIFDFRLRVEPMNVKTTTEVLASSFSKFNIALEAPEEERLQQIIDNISGEKSGIQLPYLQVYLDMLYREDHRRTYPAGNPEQYPPLEFTRQEIENFGRIDNVLESFLEEQKVALQGELGAKFDAPENAVGFFLDALVTEEGTKRPFYFSRENDQKRVSPHLVKLLPNISDKAIDYAIDALEKRRIIRYTSDTSFELAHDSLGKLIDQKRTDEQRLRNEVLRSLLTNYKESKETEQLLTEKQLNRYEPFLPVLNLGDDVLDFIGRSEQNVVLLKEQEKEELAEKERVAQERKRARLRRKLMWVIGAFALVAVAFGIIAGIQNQKAQISKKEAEKNTVLANLLNYENLYEAAKTLKAEGNYDKASQKVEKAIAFFQNDIASDPNVRKYKDSIKLETPLPRVSSLKKKQKNWVVMDSLAREGKAIYDKSTDDIVEKGEDEKLLEALAIFEEALAYDPEDVFLQSKVKATQDVIGERYDLWLERANRFVNYRQCYQARQAIKIAEMLDPVAARTDTLFKEINYRRRSLRDERKCHRDDLGVLTRVGG